MWEWKEIRPIIQTLHVAIYVQICTWVLAHCIGGKGSNGLPGEFLHWTWFLQMKVGICLYTCKPPCNCSG